MAENKLPVRNVIEFACGTRASITELNQSSTYNGMLEGYPNQRINAILVKGFTEQLEKKHGQKVLLIPPIETPKPDEFAPLRNPWMELPGVACEAHLFSKSLGEFGSSLIVCWYQDEFAFPVARSVLEALACIAWRERARPHDAI